MACPGTALQKLEHESILQFLRDRISAAKCELAVATKVLDRTPRSRKAKNRYSESFYQYCRVLYEASVYSTQGVAPAGYVRREPGPEELR